MYKQDDVEGLFKSSMLQGGTASPYKPRPSREKGGRKAASE
jgi:hypothetical protein